MNKKKILTSSLIMAMAFSAIGSVTNVLDKGDVSPFISQAYAAGKVIELGEGRTLEVLEEPKFEFIQYDRIQYKNFKFRLKGFKSGDKLKIVDQKTIITLSSDYKKTDKSKEIEVYGYFLPRGLSIVETNTNLEVGETVDNSTIVFNDNIDKFESVDVRIKEAVFYSRDMYYKDKPTKEPFYVSLKASVNSEGNSNLKDIYTTKFSIDKTYKYNLLKYHHKQHASGIFVNEENSSYDIFYDTFFTNKEPLKLNDKFTMTYVIPDSINLKKDVIEDKIIKKVVLYNKAAYSTDLAKGVDRFILDNFPISIADNFDVKVDKTRNEEEKTTTYKVDMTVKGDVLVDGIIGITGPDFSFDVPLENLDFKTSKNLAYIINKDTVRGSFVHESSGSVVGDTNFDLNRIRFFNGYIDANGIFRLNKNKSLKGTEKIVEVGDKVKPSDFVLNPDRLPKGTKFEYAGKDPDTSKVISKDPIKIKAIYPDGKTEETTGLLTVVPVDKSKFVTINYLLENGTKVKSEEVLKVNATKVSTPETEIPKGYELVNWVKK